MTRALLLIAVLAMAACQMRPPPQQASTQYPEEENAIVVLVTATGQPARDLMHELAARCWLDGVVAGAQLIVKPSGNLEIVGDRYLLVAADYVGRKGARSRWQLKGTAIGDPVQRARLVETLDLAARTGQTACPRIVG